LSLIQVADNVHLVKWMPQNDILGHTKTQLFITHGGSNSQYEALFHGVPMIVIPMFAEQGWNCARARHKGIALCHDLLTFTADDLYNSIIEIINNATYRKNIQRLSAIQRGEPMNGCQKAGYWIDHVMKYGGEHLRSPALDLSIFQLLMFDVIGFILLVVLIVGFILIVLMRFACRRMQRSSKEKKH
jgi:glucuronosyltransferase